MCFTWVLWCTVSILAVIHVGFNDFLYRLCMTMLLLMWVLRGFSVIYGCLGCSCCAQACGFQGILCTGSRLLHTGMWVLSILWIQSSYFLHKHVVFKKFQ